MRAGSRRRVFGAEALDFVEINVGVLSARRGQAGDPNRHLIKIRISPHPVKEGDLSRSGGRREAAD